MPKNRKFLLKIFKFFLKKSKILTSNFQNIGFQYRKFKNKKNVSLLLLFMSLTMFWENLDHGFYADWVTRPHFFFNSSLRECLTSLRPSASTQFRLISLPSAGRILKFFFSPKCLKWSKTSILGCFEILTSWPPRHPMVTLGHPLDPRRWSMVWEKARFFKFKVFEYCV